MARRGICRYCGCSDQDPCMIRTGSGFVGGCWWVDAGETVCSMPLCQQAAIEDGLIPAPGQKLVIAS